MALAGGKLMLARYHRLDAALPVYVARNTKSAGSRRSIVKFHWYKSCLFILGFIPATFNPETASTPPGNGLLSVKDGVQGGAPPFPQTFMFVKFSTPGANGPPVFPPALIRLAYRPKPPRSTVSFST